MFCQYSDIYMLLIDLHQLRLKLSSATGVLYTVLVRVVSEAASRVGLLLGVINRLVRLPQRRLLSRQRRLRCARR
jgi:hypothetical protein